MIRVHFFDWGYKDLDVEKELRIDLELDEYLAQKVRGLELEATDNQNDMDDNVIFYFSAENEEKASNKIKNILDILLLNSSNMKYTVKIINSDILY